ncbi:MAG: iron-sulfur cluster assembly scaffold protein [Thermodesulfobacteriota bacterium]
MIDITGETVLDAIGRLPKEDHHCARVAAEALQKALSDYMYRKQIAKCRIKQE